MHCSGRATWVGLQVVPVRGTAEGTVEAMGAGVVAAEKESDAYTPQ